MLVPDENISRGTEEQLRAWGIRARVVGDHFLPEDAADENIIPLLHCLAQPSFFTHDVDFYRRELCHPGHALVWLDLSPLDSLIIGLRGSRGTHPEVDVVLARLDAAKKTAATWQTIAPRRSEA